MACKKSELIAAIESYSKAKLSKDDNLMNLSAHFLQKYIDTLEYDPEEEPEEPLSS